MREDTIGRKKASHLFQELRGRRWLLGRMLEVISEGKRGLDGLALGSEDRSGDRSCNHTLS